MSESHQIAALIEHAARILDVCPRAVFSSLKLHRKNRVTIARRCVMLHMFRSECPLDRIARAFGLTGETIAKDLRLARLMEDYTEYRSILSTLPTYTPSTTTTPAPIKRSCAAKHPI